MDACRALYAIGRCNFGIFPTPDGEVQLECDDGFEIRVGAR